MISTILDIIFPVNCLACGSKGSDLCVKCLLDSPSAERESAKWIFPLYDYRHPPIKKALWLLKYKGKKRLTGVFAEAMYGRILEELSELSVMQNFYDAILIPIPLSSKRHRERGYNQAELICQELIELDRQSLALAKLPKQGFGENQGINFKLEKNILIKHKDTEHQARIENRAERLKNIVGSFSIKNRETAKGRNIILIDDVTTTGATLNEARKILKQAGAKKIIAFTVAH